MAYRHTGGEAWVKGWGTAAGAEVHRWRAGGERVVRRTLASGEMARGKTASREEGTWCAAGVAARSTCGEHIAQVRGLGRWRGRGARSGLQLVPARRHGPEPAGHLTPDTIGTAVEPSRHRLHTTMPRDRQVGIELPGTSVTGVVRPRAHVARCVRVQARLGQAVAARTARPLQPFQLSRSARRNRRGQSVVGLAGIVSVGYSRSAVVRRGLTRSRATRLDTVRPYVGQPAVALPGVTWQTPRTLRPRHALTVLPARGTAPVLGMAAARPVHPPAPAFRARPPPVALGLRVLRAAGRHPAARSRHIPGLAWPDRGSRAHSARPVWTAHVTGSVSPVTPTIRHRAP